MKHRCHHSRTSGERGSTFAEYSMIAAILVVATIAVIGVFRGAVVADNKARTGTQPFAQSTRPLLFNPSAPTGPKH